MISKELKITGMSCQHCVMAVRKELEKLKGLKINSLEIGKAEVEIDENLLGDADIKKSIEEAGFSIVEE